MDRIFEYSHKARIVKQIQSNKAKKYKKINTIQDISTVVVSSLITFMGFSGNANIKSYIDWVVTTEVETIGLAFNLLVFFLLVFVILHLVFRFGPKQSDSERAIVILSNFINEVEDLIEKHIKEGSHLDYAKVEVIRYKYESIQQVIPPNTDKEYYQAKKDFQEKEIIKSQYLNPWEESFDDSKHIPLLINIIKNSDSMMKILNEIKSLGEDFYLGGGLVRNLVWDYMHNHKQETPIEDVDVIYYNKLNIEKVEDEKVEKVFKQKVPNINWSVKNQARMHIYNDEPQYSSMTDAISKWPETCTAFVVKLDNSNNLEFIAPFGFRDLFRLIVRPTEHFQKSKLGRYQERITSKKWQTKWPKLIILSFD